MKNMNENSGESIKSTAAVLFVVSIVIDIIIACVVAFNVSEALLNRIVGGSAVAAAVLFAIVAVGYLVSWIGYQMLCGFGDIVEYTAERADRYRNVYEKMLLEEETQSQQ